MRPRDPAEPARTASTLELFFDLVFAAAGAFSAGIEVEIDVLTGDSELHAPWSSFASSIPLAVFLLGVWAVAIRCNAERIVRTVLPWQGCWCSSTRCCPCRSVSSPWCSC